AKSMNIKLNKESKVLIADLGAGTSDFSVINMKNGNFSSSDILSVSGVNIAGDSFDYSLMKNFILPDFGSRVKYKRPGSSIEHGISKTLIQQMSTPAVFSLINDSNIESYIEDAQDFVTDSKDLERLDNLESLFDSKLGFDLMKEVEGAKINLSSNLTSELIYNKRGVKLKNSLSQKDYFNKSDEVTEKIINSLKESLETANTHSEDIEYILCTGGSVQNPLFLEKLKEIFGAEKLILSNKQGSVVFGLE
uniref:Hsp70 family protein n=1 Tax=Halobacteriovorax sp. TaxID=2020862 RepID=UPI003565DC90